MDNEPLPRLLNPWEQQISDTVRGALQSDTVRQSEHFTFLDPDTLILIYTSLRDTFTASDEQLFTRAGEIDAISGPFQRRYPTSILEMYEHERIRLMHESGIEAEIASSAAVIIMRGEIAQREFSLRFVQEHPGPIQGLLRGELHHHGLMTTLKALGEVSYRLYET